MSQQRRSSEHYFEFVDDELFKHIEQILIAMRVENTTEGNIVIYGSEWQRMKRASLISHLRDTLLQDFAMNTRDRMFFDYRIEYPMSDSPLLSIGTRLLEPDGIGVIEYSTIVQRVEDDQYLIVDSHSE